MFAIFLIMAFVLTVIIASLNDNGGWQSKEEKT